MNNQSKILMIMLKITIVVLTACGLLIIFLRYIEVKTIFYPDKEVTIFPDQVKLGFQDVFFETSDNLKINAWMILSRNAKYTILFFHGNAGNISHRIEKIKFFNDLECNVFIVDYRGYGRSQGKPSEAGLYKDAQAAYAYLVSKGILANQIIGYGESIGGAVVVDLARQKKMKAIILDSTLSSLKDMVKYSYPFIPYWVFASRFDSESKIKVIKIPKLIIHSVNDEIVPFIFGKKLYIATPEPKQFLQIHGGHNSNFYEAVDILREGISGFIKNLPSE